MSESLFCWQKKTQWAQRICLKQNETVHPFRILSILIFIVQKNLFLIKKWWEFFSIFFISNASNFCWDHLVQIYYYWNEDCSQEFELKTDILLFFFKWANWFWHWFWHFHCRFCQFYLPICYFIATFVMSHFFACSSWNLSSLFYYYLLF